MCVLRVDGVMAALYIHVHQGPIILSMGHNHMRHARRVLWVTIVRRVVQLITNHFFVQMAITVQQEQNSPISFLAQLVHTTQLPTRHQDQ